ncbi:glycoside hydrolase family 99-like domain-containing protein [Natribaculum luteum]|uniref:Glycoside hydrolase family 99-like domain-containing protein n=1 Tax=Natribaculum luteum TaxID=1586232 RepID=A0ABD5P124_9EURY|nr:glycoside hydrolase family 99-like domain-containing protein [Natribaculum luteum]
MREELRRRRLLQLGGAGIAGLAGCSSNENQLETPSGQERTPTATPPSETPTEETTTSTSDPVDEIDHDKLIGVQYYAWYWGDEGFGGQFLSTDAPDSWLSATPGTPELGAYDSRDVEVVNQHMKWCLEHGINWWIITGGRPDGPIDTTIRDVVFEADYADQMNFTLLVGFPPEIRDDDGRFDFDHPRAEELITRWFTHWADHHVPDPNYLRLGDDRPPLYFWSTSGAKGDMPGVFQAARDAVDVDAYVIGGPDYYNQPRRMSYNAETFDAVLDYHSYFPDEAFLDAFDTAVIENHQRWRAAAHEYNLEFIPTVTPGFDHREAPAEFRDDRLLPALERSPERFRDHCRQLRGLGDHDAIVITSFNEWPEYSAIEPSEEYDMTYLETVAEELARTDWETPSSPALTPIVLEYEQTVEPAEQNPDSDDTRELAVMVDQLRVATADGTLAVDIGGDEGQTFFTEGVYGSESDGERTWRWFGGETAQTRLFVPTTDISELILVARAVTDNITVTVRIGDTQMGTIAIGGAWNTYSTG